ncbi:hypothetical protein [Cellulomonas oligotrophica]|uniref:DUF2975 domain-containing protein n=1 Tax=Cellulomonas oligotrophica TaxID=931536 RepID=A0A7Y9FH25_9CELL|nr:hypothetical protein [Cellulomonas oligotrophica]NYD87120.1 hypothetical protein [Cellulomonas oligotrophica]GIG32094.1 hypothetical protein Col01nite_12530 [Cellulomonas oligotrophica]
MTSFGPRSRRLAAVLGPFLVVVGAVALLLGVGHGVAVLSEDDVAVPVHLRASDGRGAWLQLEVEGRPATGVWVSGVPTGGLPTADRYGFGLGVAELHTRGATPVERLLARADLLVRGIALIVAALALRPVLAAVARGASFRPGHDRRVHVVAVCVVLGAYVAPLLPWLATASVLARLDDLHGLSASPPHHVEALVVALLVVLVGGLVRASTTHPDGGSGRGGRAATIGA